MVLEIKEFGGGVSSFSDRGPRGSFKFASGIDIRKDVDTLSCGQALEEEGILGTSHSSSPSTSPSRSLSPSSSGSASQSDSSSASASVSPSSSGSRSSSTSLSPSGSASPSSSVSPSPSGATTSIIEDLILFFVKASDGNTYGFGNGGHIYRRYSDGFTRMV